MAKIRPTTIQEEETKKKDTYRVTNWSTYNKSLVNRGDITIWIDEEAIAKWYYGGPDQRGAQFSNEERIT